MKFWVKVENHETRVEIEERNGIFVVRVNGTERVVDCRNAGHSDYLSLIIDNKSYLVESAPLKIDEGRYYANISGRRYDVEVLDERLIATRQAGVVTHDDGPYVIASPMPGLIVDVRVKVGDEVSIGSPVAVMEAMKMQNELVSEVDGVVKAVNVQVKDAVESQAPLIEIERSK
ncbi:MAG: acetyl-CoA carboxylase biotin carboxyl carrier protein subunit [Candidatus Latescibacterota bacterium]|nr:MAG: acetyl-CoA carboxylase biotin carboxyl carrier protein subunit [Candidatus Latescibacterota bacterium]